MRCNMRRYILNIDPKILNDVSIKNEYFLEDITINETKLRFIFYIKNPERQSTLEDLKNSVAIAYRRKGFVFLNFSKENQENVYEKITNFIESDDYNKLDLKAKMLKRAEVPFADTEKIIKNLSKTSFFTENKINLSEKNILKAWMLKEMQAKEEEVNHKIPPVGVFVYSPDDVSTEREKAKDIINGIKTEGLFSKKMDIHCETLNWESSSGKRKLSSLKNARKNSIYKYKIIVVILWKVFQLKISDGGSKIEEELQELLNYYQHYPPDKTWAMFYFRGSAIPQNELGEHVFRQWEKLKEFRAEVQEKEICATYDDEREFTKKFRGYILSVLGKIATGFKDPAEGKVYIELSAMNSENEKMGTLIDSVDKSVESGKSVAIIGEFGTGKTTFASYYKNIKRLEWLENPSKSKLVTFLNLNEYSKKKENSLSMYKWIKGNIEPEIGFDIKREEYKKYLKEKKLLLIFDGLDEVANLQDKDDVNKSLREIKNISHKGSPVIITSRKTFLETEVDQRNLKNFTRLYIKDLDISQIRDFVKKKIPGDWENFIESVFGKKEINDLDDLSENNKEVDSSYLALVRRPLFLDMMIHVYQRGHLTRINNAADLYEVLTNDSMSEESNKEETSLEEEDMKQIIQELAFKMFLDNHFSYTDEELKEIVYKISDKISNTLKQKYDPETILKDISNVSFLVRDKVVKSKGKIAEEKNFVAFKHRSFIEYFTAHKFASELKERNTDNFSIKILYEEIFEFLAWIMTEKSGKDEDLTNILGDPIFPFKARVNAIPPLRKQRNEKAIDPLMNAHTDIKGSHPLLRFVCGYTLGIFQEKFPEKFKSQEAKDRLDESYKKEKNSLIRLRTALLLTEGKYKQSEYGKYKELNPDYDFSPSSLNEILEPSKTLEAYDKILKVNREHHIVLEESIRILTIYVLHNAEKEEYKNTLSRYIFNVGHKHESERIRRISLWSMDRLGLFEPKDKREETLKTKTKAGRIVADVLIEDKSTFVKEIAKNIMAKYPEYFLAPHLR